MGEPHAIRLAPAAVRQIKSLQPAVQKRVVKCLDALSDDPRPSGVEKLYHKLKLWRVRVGEYRVVYLIENTQRVVIVLLVKHRKDVYRELEKLDPVAVAQAIAPLLLGSAREN